MLPDRDVEFGRMVADEDRSPSWKWDVLMALAVGFVTGALFVAAVDRRCGDDRQAADALVVEP